MRRVLGRRQQSTTSHTSIPETGVHIRVQRGWGTGGEGRRFDSRTVVQHHRGNAVCEVPKGEGRTLPRPRASNAVRIPDTYDA